MLRLAIDTHLITSHHLLPLLIDKPGGLLVEVTDGTADYNASRYRISVFYDLAKVAVNRLAFSQGHELEPHGSHRRRHHAGLAALGDDARQLRRHRGELARRPRPDAPAAAHRATGLRPVRVASLRRTGRRRAGLRSGPGSVEPAVGQLRPARAGCTASPTSTAPGPTSGGSTRRLAEAEAPRTRTASADALLRRAPPQPAPGTPSPPPAGCGTPAGQGG